MSSVLQAVGAIWTGIGFLAAVAAFSGQGVAFFTGAIGLGIFAGLVLYALGHIAGQIEILVQH